MGRSAPPPDDWEHLDDDDPRLLARAVGPVRRLRQPSAPAPSVPRPQPQARQFEADETAAVRASHRPEPEQLAAGDATQYRRAELPLSAFKRLRRGLYAVQDEIDLHHAGIDLAADLLRGFLQEAKARELRCVRVVHGKGLRSADRRAVLRPWVEAQLRQRNDVLGFCSAPPRQGGTGALLVLLGPARVG
jgi:DNA-nicking Smr family endonuclease